MANQTEGARHGEARGTDSPNTDAVIERLERKGHPTPQWLADRMRAYETGSLAYQPDEEDYREMVETRKRERWESGPGRLDVGALRPVQSLHYNCEAILREHGLLRADDGRRSTAQARPRRQTRTKPKRKRRSLVDRNRRMAELRDSGWTLSRLAREFGLSKGQVSKIRKRVGQASPLRSNLIAFPGV